MSIVINGIAMEQDFYLRLHPETRLVVCELDQKLVRGEGLHVTEVLRTDDDSERIYMQVAARLLKSGGKGLGPLEHRQWEELQNLSSLGHRAWARRRASWHKAWTAVDIGLWDWTPGELAVMSEFLHKRCPKPAWEVITEFHGTGPHLHLARRDYEWLKAFPGGLREAKGRVP